jgi:HK97 family phage major capsid protein
MNYPKKSLFKRNIKAKIEYRSMPTLLEKRNTLLDEMNGILDKAKAESRAINEDENGRFDAIKAEISGIDATLAKEEEARSFEKTKIVKPGQTEEEKRALEIEKEERAFLDYLREGRATGGLAVAGQNGITIPLSVSQKIVDKVVNMSNLISKVTVVNTNGDLSVPVTDFTQITAGYITEFTTITNSNGAFTNIVLKNQIIGALSLIGRSMINRADFDVLGYVVNQVAKALAYFIEGELIKGTGGAGKLNGLAQIAVGQQLTGATTLVIDSAELVKLQLKLPQVYQGSAEWLMHPNTLAYIQSLKASTGQFLMGNTLSEDGRYTLLGRPVNLSDQCPQIGAGALEIFFGDFSGLWVKMTKNVEMDVLREKYADQYAYGITAFLECDSAIVEPQKIVAYKGL